MSDTPSPIKVLVIDKDTSLCTLVAEFLAVHDVSVESIHDGQRGLIRALEGAGDAILMELTLPGLDGLELLRLLRRQSPVPVVVVTARSGTSVRIAALEAGADDYVTKPCALEELLARLRAVVRRSRATPGRARILSVNGVTLDFGSRHASIAGVHLPLTATEYSLLEHLVRSAGRVVTRDELTTVTLHREASPLDRALDVHLSHLRRKMGAHGALVRTVRNAGYFFCAVSDFSITPHLNAS